MTSGGEEVWNFMRLGIGLWIAVGRRCGRLGMGQEGGCGSKGLSEIDGVSFTLHVRQYSPQWPKMSLKCLKCASKWPQNGLKIGSTWAQNGLFPIYTLF